MGDSAIEQVLEGSSLWSRLEERLRLFHPSDLLSAQHHSRDFDGSRADNIDLRTRLLSLLIGVLTSLWIPVDWLMLDAEQFSVLVQLRLSVSAVLILVGVIHLHHGRLWMARLRLLVFVVTLALFYPLSVSAVTNPDGSMAIAGYSFLPMVLTGLLAVFPLVLIESLFALAVVFLSMLLALPSDGLLTISVLDDFWLWFLLAGVALWVQLSQLQMLMRLHREATLDGLTGLFNRRVLTRFIEQQLEAASSNGSVISVLLCDLDRFKRINDTFGHPIGDDVLCSFSEVLSQSVEEPGLVGRYGGEEFLVILPGSDLESAAAVAEKIRTDCHGRSVAAEGEQSVSFTTSIGVAERRPKETAEELLARVDEGLYNAKESGRDMVARA